jgi:hypothetical protein
MKSMGLNHTAMSEQSSQSNSGLAGDRLRLMVACGAFLLLSSALMLFCEFVPPMQ